MILAKRSFQIVCLVMLTWSTIVGQDIHFTQFNMSPLTINPAMTGAFNGSFRLGGIYRDQWASTFSTPAFYIDSPILKGFRDLDWVGAGVVFYQDNATAEFLQSDGRSGKGRVKQGGMLGSIAYHFAADDKRRTIISLGLQVGTLSRKLQDNFLFEDQILTGSTDERLPDKEDPTSFLDISGGLTITGRTVGNSYFRVGASVMHANQPDYGLLSTNSASLPMKIVGFGTYVLDINESFMAEPSILFESIGPATEVAAQALGGYKFDAETVLKAGLGYRIGDALQVLAGVQYKDLRVGASYDLTLSALENPNGAFELAVAYIGKIYKRPKVDPVIFCPRF